MMNSKSQRWLVAAQSIQSAMMVAVVFGFFVIRMNVGALLDHIMPAFPLPALTEWVLNAGPTSGTSALALGIFCAATHMFLSMVAIERSKDTANGLSRCYLLASVWLVFMFYFLVMIVAVLLPLIPVSTKMYGPEEARWTYIRKSEINPWVWLCLSMLYTFVLAIMSRRFLKTPRENGQSVDIAATKGSKLDTES